MLVTTGRPETVNPLALGQWLRAQRRARRLTVRRFAKRAHISPAYLEQLESGRRLNPSLPVLVSLAQALRLRPVHVLTAWQQGYRHGTQTPKR